MSSPRVILMSLSMALTHLPFLGLSVHQAVGCSLSKPLQPWLIVWGVDRVDLGLGIGELKQLEWIWVLGFELLGARVALVKEGMERGGGPDRWVQEEEGAQEGTEVYGGCTRGASNVGEGWRQVTNRFKAAGESAGHSKWRVSSMWTKGMEWLLKGLRWNGIV